MQITKNSDIKSVTVNYLITVYNSLKAIKQTKVINHLVETYKNETIDDIELVTMDQPKTVTIIKAYKTTKIITQKQLAVRQN